MAVIGGMCYSIYLLHYPLIALIMTFTKRIIWTDSFTINYMIQFALIVPLLLFVSAVFFYYVEKPCMKRDWHLNLAKKVKDFVIKPA